MMLMDSIDTHFSNFIELRKSLGYRHGRWHVGSELSDYFTRNYPDETAITKRMFDAWLEQREFKTNSNHAHIVTNARTFLRYLRFVGEDVFIPGDDYSVNVPRYTPYIFTDDELTRLFNAFDSIPASNASPKREYIIPVLFRMMYCCGMRPGEPLSILKQDIDLNSGEIYIRQAKGYKDRRILISDDLLELCRKYAGLMPTEKYFFERILGERISTEWAGDQFILAWSLSGLPKRGHPRPYDLRHNFAARLIIRWVNEGKEVLELMPFLSAYLGHMDLDSTLYYVHLVPERLFKNKGIDWQRFKSIYSEADNGKAKS